MTLDEINNVFFNDGQISEKKIQLQNKNFFQIKKIKEKTLYLWIEIPGLIINPKMIYRFDDQNNLIKEQIKFNLVKAILCHAILPITILILILFEFDKNKNLIHLFKIWYVIVFLIIFFIGLQMIIGLLMKDKIKNEIHSFLSKFKNDKNVC